MPWTEITRRDYRRDGLRYASDLTDAEWALIAPLMPACKRAGRPRTTDLRQVMDALLYMATTGCQWRMLPKDLHGGSGGGSGDTILNWGSGDTILN